MANAIDLVIVLAFWWFFLGAVNRSDWPKIVFWAVALLCFTLNGLVR